MKRFVHAALFTVLFALAVSAFAYAGLLDKGRAWITGEVAALAITTLLAIIGGATGLLFGKIARTFREAGEFLTTLGAAVEDRRITRDELAAVIREGRDIFTLWR